MKIKRASNPCPVTAKIGREDKRLLTEVSPFELVVRAHKLEAAGPVERSDQR